VDVAFQWVVGGGAFEEAVELVVVSVAGGVGGSEAASAGGDGWGSEATGAAGVLLFCAASLFCFGLLEHPETIRSVAMRSMTILRGIDASFPLGNVQLRYVRHDGRELELVEVQAFASRETRRTSCMAADSQRVVNDL